MVRIPPVIGVVDDEDTVRRALRRLLRSAGYEILEYDSGESFLATLPDGVPDCLVLDLHMPKVDGFAVLSRFGATHPGTPVVVITGHDTDEARDRTRSAGVAAYLRKPVDGQVLIDAIEAALDTP